MHRLFYPTAGFARFILGAFLLLTNSRALALDDEDVSFGQGGKFVSSFGGLSESGPGYQRVAVMPDGRIVVGFARRSPSMQGSEVALMMLTEAGTIDPGFGTLGILTISFGANSQCRVCDVAVEADGRILVAAESWGGSSQVSASAIFGVNPGGELDPSFGAGGRVNVAAESAAATCLGLLPGGKFVVGGSISVSGGSVFQVCRLDENGALDPTFGSAGKRSVEFRGRDQMTALEIQPDGKILAAGNTYRDLTWNDYALARFTADGDLDSAFGTNGRVITIAGAGPDVLSSVKYVPLPEGDRIVVAGLSADDYDLENYPTICSYTSSGQPVTTYGINGIARLPYPTINTIWQDIRSLIVQPDGKLIATGYGNGIEEGSDVDGDAFMTFRVTLEGHVDTTFGDFGYILTSFRSNRASYGADNVAYHGDKFIVVGTTEDHLGAHLAVARYRIAGTPDATLGIDVDGDNLITTGADSPDYTTAEKPFRFWLNDDNDDDSESDDNDEKGGDDMADGPSDNSDGVIDCSRDLEDFSRIVLSVPAHIRPWLVNGGGVRFVTRGTGAIRVRQLPSPDSPYLTDAKLARCLVNGAGSQMPSYLMAGDATTLTALDMTAISASGDVRAGFLFEGVTGGDFAVKATLVSGSGSELAQTGEIHLRLLPIEQFYDHFTVGNTDLENAPVLTLPSPMHQNAVGRTDPTVPYVLLVHGWRLRPWERKKFAETAFKRLYWQGYRGAFGLFSWPTEWMEDGLQNLDRYNYDRSELQAWKSATGLRVLLDQLENGSTPRVRLLAHSMGNVVASEALRLGLESGGKKIACYLASQAATVASAYDPSVPAERVVDGADVYRNWKTSAPPEKRHFFSGISNMSAGGIVSLCNPKDYAFVRRVSNPLFSGSWELNQSSKPDLNLGYGIDAGEYVKLGSLGYRPIDFSDPGKAYEAIAFAAPATSSALGTTPSVRGEIGSVVRLDDRQPFYGDSRWDHSAPFLSTIQRQNPYWKLILGHSGITDIPVYPPKDEATTFGDWWAFWFPGSEAGEDAEGDFDGDGHSNFFEYAFGTNPREPDPKAPAVKVAVVANSEGPQPSLHYSASLEILCRISADDVNFMIESSSDLQHWSEALLETSWPENTDEKVRKLHVKLLPSRSDSQFFRITPLRVAGS